MDASAEFLGTIQRADAETIDALREVSSKLDTEYDNMVAEFVNDFTTLQNKLDYWVSKLIDDLENQQHEDVDQGNRDSGGERFTSD